VNRTAERVWRRVPPPAKDAAKRAWSGWARITSPGRLLPDYLMIGTQRGGTTSLYKYLVRHPAHAHALTKELRFFDLHYARGLAWYRSCFPSTAYRAYLKRTKGLDLVVGEASPDYLFHPQVPVRVSRHLPEARFVVVLRDPVERAHSHYWHQVKRGHEDLTFEEAVDREPERLAGELERLQRDPTYVSYEYHHHSYVARGRYAEQLERWFDRFGRDRFLVERSEDFFADPDAVARRVQAFLGLPPRDVGPYEVFNQFTSGSMDPEMRSRLRSEFASSNARLAEFLGRDMGWDG
jgi:hypothetical protein